MPYLTLPTSGPGEPALDVRVGVSVAQAALLTGSGQTVPQPVVARALLDTGASTTCVEPGVLGPLNLLPRGIAFVHTPTTGGAPHLAQQFDVSVTLGDPAQPYTLPDLPVIEALLAGRGLQLLLGRDVLAHCLFVYDGRAGRFSLAF
jgi:hypothetical protein